MSNHAIFITHPDFVEAYYPPDDSIVRKIREATRPEDRLKRSRVESFRVQAIKAAAVPAMVRVLRDAGVEVREYGTVPTSNPDVTIPAPDPDRVILGVRADAPWPVVEGAYRALARMYHPDPSAPTASHSKMIAVNVAYERLQKKRGATS